MLEMARKSLEKPKKPIENAALKENKAFGSLLRDAVRTVAHREGKKIGVLDDELGLALGKSGGATTLQYWKVGHIPPFNLLRDLGTMLAKRGGLDAVRLRDLLIAAGYPHIDDLVQQLFPEKSAVITQSRASSTATTLSSKPAMPAIEPLIGRAEWVEKALNHLHSSAVGIVGIDGIGGIGKTAFARHIADRAIADGIVSKCILITAHRTDPHEYAHTLSSPIESLTFERVLDEIFMHLGLPQLESEPPERKIYRVQDAFHQSPLLLVLDNLETAAEDQTSLIRKLKPLLGLSKLVLTSRHRFRQPAFAMHLDGLRDESAFEFMQHTGKVHHLNIATWLEERYTTQINRETGGSPLAIKLVLGQSEYLAVADILTQLKLPHSAKKSPSDEYLGLYRHIYIPTWNTISLSSKKMLIALRQFAPSHPVSFEWLPTMGKLSREESLAAIEQLWLRSLIERATNPLQANNASQAVPGYYLHPLTRQFVQHEVLQQPLSKALTTK